jgi:hypothetical protein
MVTEKKEVLYRRTGLGDRLQLGLDIRFTLGYRIQF